MVTDNQDPKGTNYAVSCDARAGVTTGISAADRATTVRALAMPDSTPDDFHRPGHVFPLGAHPGGLSERAGHTEAALELMRLANKRPVAVIAEISNDDGTMAHGEQLEQFAATWNTPLISIAELQRSLNAQGQSPQWEECPTVEINTAFGPFTARAFREQSGLEHLLLSSALTQPAPEGGTHGSTDDAEAPLVRVHSECLTGDVFGSARCDCGDQLDATLRLIAREGGHLVYLRGQEGRGIGLFEKIRAYAKQDAGLDTVEANLALGHRADARSYTAAATILRAAGIERIRLITNNPAKERELTGHQIVVTERVHVATPVHRDNLKYLNTKQHRMGHLLNLSETATEGHRA